MAGHFSSRASFSSTAARMNSAALLGPTTASMRAMVSSGSRTVVGFTPRGGRPMRRPLSATALCVDAIQYPQPLIDGVSATAYISAIGYGGKAMSKVASLSHVTPAGRKLIDEFKRREASGGLRPSYNGLGELIDNGMPLPSGDGAALAAARKLVRDGYALLNTGWSNSHACFRLTDIGRQA